MEAAMREYQYKVCCDSEGEGNRYWEVSVYRRHRAEDGEWTPWKLVVKKRPYVDTLAYTDGRALKQLLHSLA
jgi:hypothetical protein